MKDAIGRPQGLHYVCCICAVLAASLTIAAAGPRTFTVDTGQSKALIDVGKAGAFSFAGHTHEVEAPLTSGVVHLDPDNISKSDLRLQFNTAEMKVTGKGDPPADVPKVTEAMLGEQVLDVKRYPSITFESTAVSGRGSASALDLQITGNLTIRGTTKPVRAATTAKIDGSTLTATGRFAIKQTDFGIKPISVGGVVKVKDELSIAFTIVARER
jgi:polyisoprenoid-binding protein YceI